MLKRVKTFGWYLKLLSRDGMGAAPHILWPLRECDFPFKKNGPWLVSSCMGRYKSSRGLGSGESHHNWHQTGG